MTLSAGRGRWLGLLFLSLYASTSSADSILPSSASSSFPECGLSCTALTQAQSSCESAAESTWVSCFCQSSLLTGLKTSGSLCSSCTSSSDQSLLSTWYNNYCNSGGTDTGSSTSSTTSAGTATATNSASTASTTAGKSTSNTSAADENKSWWSTHYQWVIMLIVLAIGFGAIAAGGVWLKRRYDAKRPGLYHGGSAAGSSGVLSGNPVSNSNSGVLSPPPPAWASSPGPNQSQSLASSSRTDIAATRGNAPTPGSRTRLPKQGQTEGDVEIRQVSLRQ
ncbi:uncharacterized protein N7496_002042 [Penicillium cataractarum]|uniref:Integral membrane protein n=1 Tax=Penicillium cataractarum TaxID=2100454 RepID=A0A9W9VXK2_9EURO|nr:uncharacterized protein N7496_002042 [Penicillium cataractarum]KAJ5390974.1 hypothetical protein N7496_002042 [Penicillium cataractarum]